MRFTNGLVSSLALLVPVSALADPTPTPVPVTSPTPVPVTSPTPAPVQSTPAQTTPTGPTTVTTVSPAPAPAPAPAATQQVVVEAAVEPAPPVPAAADTVVEQAGVGSLVGYARAGVLELGGSAGLTLAQDIRAMNVSPSLGFFLVDNFEISGILDVTNLKAGSESATLFSALAEPSFHFPFNPSVFGFFGMGVGAAYQSDLGTGLAVAPRIGMDVMVGRSGVLRPSLSYQYTTHDAMSATDSDGNSNVTLVAVSSALRFNIGYSAMW